MILLLPLSNVACGTFVFSFVFLNVLTRLKILVHFIVILSSTVVVCVGCSVCLVSVC